MLSLAESKALVEDKVDEVCETVTNCESVKIKKRFDRLQTYLESGVPIEPSTNEPKS